MNTKLLHSETVDDKRRFLAEKLVLHCGVPACLIGYDALVDCVNLSSEMPSYGICNIYAAVGAARKIKPRSVLRNISYAICKANNIAESLSNIVGARVLPQEVHAGLVISYLGKIVKNPILSPLYDAKTGVFRLNSDKRRLG